jgi:Uma2 family endonuclease
MAVMSTTAHPRKTVKDLMALPPETRAELIDGTIEMTPTPNLPHQRAVTALWRVVADWAEAVGAGEAFVAPLDVFLPSGDVVEPDVLFVSNARREILRKWVHGVPDLVVEVLSPKRAKRDRALKRDVYARNGVPEYWIVDPVACAIDVLRLDAGNFVAAGHCERGDTLVSPTLVGLSFPVAKVFPSR